MPTATLSALAAQSYHGTAPRAEPRRAGKERNTRASAVASMPATVPDAAAAAGDSTGTGSGATTTADDSEAMTTAAHYDADYLDNPAPAYPAASRRLGEQGTVLLRVRVMHDGRPQAIEVLAGSGSPRLDRAAAEAVRRWRFVPATQHGAPVDSWLRVPIVFRLED